MFFYPKKNLIDVKDLRDGTVTHGTRPAAEPQLPGAHPAKRVAAGYKGRTFIPLHADATHPIGVASFPAVGSLPPLIRVVRTVRFFDKSHQGLYVHFVSRGTRVPRPPRIALGR